MSTYSRLGFGPVTWIEAIPSLSRQLDELVDPPNEVVNATLWSRADEKKIFKVTSASGSSSLLDLDQHSSEYPDIHVVEEIEVTTQTLDGLVFDKSKNLLVMDLQGAEYEVLLGAEKTLQAIDYVISEVNRIELYKGLGLVGDLDRLLTHYGFSRVATRWTNHGWGEALYVRTSSTESGWADRLVTLFKIMTYWCWLHFFEIPFVYIRGRLKK